MNYLKLALVVFAVALAGATVADAKSHKQSENPQGKVNNPATGIGDQVVGPLVPPGQTDDPKANAPGQAKKGGGE